MSITKIQSGSENCREKLETEIALERVGRTTVPIWHYGFHVCLIFFRLISFIGGFLAAIVH